MDPARRGVASLGLSQPHLTTVREDGGWYVSLLGTVGATAATVDENLLELQQG